MCTSEVLPVLNVFLSLSFVESPMASNRPSATGAPSVVVESMQMLLCRHVGVVPRRHTAWE